MKSLRSFAAAWAALVPAAGALYINGSVIAPCDSPIYCHGDILKEIELARPFTDSKTFVDMPAIKPLEEIQAAFAKLQKPITNNTALNDFLKENFAPAGGELKEVPEDQLPTDPKFLARINDTVIKEFVEKVIDIWPDLTRQYAGAGNCSDCPNSFIPVNRTFVIAGGRFREPYYWDSYWILEGLLRTGGAFTEISKNTIENFLDFIEQFGIIPNGARLYYLNRSQPPLLSQMLRIYIDHTNDTSILARAVPLLIKEHEFFINNRSVDITKDGKQYRLQRYNVLNTQPRPESFREDFVTATNTSYYSANGTVYPQTEALDAEQVANVYKNLATGAESGWDYGTRYLSRPDDAARDVYFPLRYLNVVDMVPLDLNAILYANEMAIAKWLKDAGNGTESARWEKLAEERSEAMHALMWNETLFSYFDFNLTSNAQYIYIPADDDATALEKSSAPEGMQVLFSIAQFYPFWMGSAPDYLKNNPLAVMKAFERVDLYLKTKAGGIPATNFKTGQQWDQPSVWPNLMHVLIDGLLKTPATFGEDDPAYEDVMDLALRLGQRYLDFTFCTWYATGGSTSETPQLQGFTEEAFGTMFEKYGDNSTNVAGSGGEYEVVEGFGWTNGVLIYTADKFADKLKRPECGDITAAHVHTEDKRSLPQRAVELSHYDSAWTKRFGRRAAKH